MIEEGSVSFLFFLFEVHDQVYIVCQRQLIISLQLTLCLMQLLVDNKLFFNALRPVLLVMVTKKISLPGLEQTLPKHDFKGKTCSHFSLRAYDFLSPCRLSNWCVQLKWCYFSGLKFLSPCISEYWCKLCQAENVLEKSSCIVNIVLSHPLWCFL